MASHKRQPKPKGESDCSWPTATVPVTSFIDVMRNADQNRSRGSLCCSVRVRSSNADSASQASRELPPLADPAITGGYPVTTDEHPAISGGYPVITDEHPVITDGYSVITDEHPAISGEAPSFQTGPPSFRRKPESRGGWAREGLPIKIRTIVPPIRIRRLHIVVRGWPQCQRGVEEPSDDGRRHRSAARRADGLATSAALDPMIHLQPNSGRNPDDAAVTRQQS